MNIIQEILEECSKTQVIEEPDVIGNQVIMIPIVQPVDPDPTVLKSLAGKLQLDKQYDILYKLCITEPLDKDAIVKECESLLK